MSKVIVDEVHICGGISVIKGLDKWLSERLETPVKVFGPEVEGVVRPDLVLAYGLAIQSIGCALCPLTILPPDVLEMRRRLKGLPYLMAALGTAVFFAVVLNVAYFVRLNKSLEGYEDQLGGLQNCNELITRIEASYSELYSREACAIPVVVAGNQCEHIKNALDVIGNACSEDDWFIYLADEKSYSPAEVKGKPREKVSNMFGGKDGPGDVAGQAEFPIKLNPRDVPVTQSYVAMSFSPNQESQPYAPAKEIAKKLDATGHFRGVDLMMEKDRAGRSDIYRSWLSFIESKVRGQYRSYLFMLPFSDIDVRKDVIPAEKESRGRK